MDQRLTDAKIRQSKPRSKPYSLPDGRGLYLCVTPSGGRLWRWGYSFEGKEKLMSFGSYPDVSLAAARERHGNARELLAHQIDPMAERKAQKTALATADLNSFASIATLWLDHWKVGKSKRHADSVRRRMEANILPRLGSRPIMDIKAPELVAMAKAVEQRGAADLAKRALETTGQVFRFAVANGYAERNPAMDFKPSDILQSVPKKNLARISAKELPHLLQKIEVYQGKTVTRLAMVLMSLTFVRTTELIEARWSEIDLDAARWDIPAERMKMKTPHIVPLATQTVETLRLLQQLTGHGELLFPGDRKPEQSMSNNTILQALKRMGYQGVMTGHGFRGLASTLLHEQGYPHEHIELQLAHAPRNAVSAAYNHALYLGPRSKMMQAWADFLELNRRGVKVLPKRKQADHSEVA